MLNKKIGAIALLAGLATGEIMAGTLTAYTTGDVLLCLRNGGTQNLVVDLGQYATFTNTTPNQRIPITQYTTDQITTAFGSVNGLNWSAFSWLDDNTLFVTKPRVNINQQSATPNSSTAAQQNSVTLQMATIPTGANYQFLNLAPNSTTTAVIEPQSAASYPSQAGWSYYEAIYANGISYTFNGTLSQGNPEVATPGDFDSSGTVIRNDLYQVPPGAGKANVIYLGYFEFDTTGAMTFVAKPSAAPVIKSLSRVGKDSVISYTAGVYGTYTLRGTSDLANAGNPTNWPAITTVTSGDTAIHSVTNTTTADINFYTITAQ